MHWFKKSREYFDYLGENFGSQCFLFFGDLILLNNPLEIFSIQIVENIFEDFDNKALVSILPSNIDSIECLANKTGFKSTKDSLTYILLEVCFHFKFSDLSSITECIETHKN